ncbi:MAG: DUF4097 family beta strand repeat protein [Candidatus Marinimicrobia bacterium]|nr:DUF4097 family beta strand repeat protein [Candidatus Neomarinimicrobiota bacterium]
MQSFGRKLSITIFTIAMAFGQLLTAQNGSDGSWEFKVKPGQELRVDLETGGTVTVKGWKQNKVSVTARSQWGDSDDIELDVKKTSYGVLVATSTPFSWREFGWGSNSPDIDFFIRVPAKFDVDLKSHGGDLNISGIEGHFEGETMGGDLELSDLKGEIDLSTMGGDIELSDASVTGRVHTMGGDVTLNNVSGGVKASTMGGDIHYKGGKNAIMSEPIRVSTMGGDITLSDVSAGGVVKTMGGDIIIKNAGKHISARTMGGDIEISALDGSVTATTMGGDVYIRMVGDVTKNAHDVELTSKGGDVTLIVPENFSMEVDITIRFNRRRANRARIDSDFDLTITEEIGEDTRWSNRNTIYGKGVFSGGKHKIKITTINGIVTLKKGR